MFFSYSSFVKAANEPAFLLAVAELNCYGRKKLSSGFPPL
jgi:hypothetical protein